MFAVKAKWIPAAKYIELDIKKEKNRWDYSQYEMHDFYFDRSLQKTEVTKSNTSSKLLSIGCWNIGNNPATWKRASPVPKTVV